MNSDGNLRLDFIAWKGLDETTFEPFGGSAVASRSPFSTPSLCVIGSLHPYHSTLTGLDETTFEPSGGSAVASSSPFSTP
eukprot:scaffold67833_cov52-Cyclotella_meneghiniana.AAC.4